MGNWTFSQHLMLDVTFALPHPWSLGVVIIETQLSWAAQVLASSAWIVLDTSISTLHIPPLPPQLLQPKLGEHQNRHICPVNVNLGHQQEMTRAGNHTSIFLRPWCKNAMTSFLGQPTIFHCSTRVTLKIHVLPQGNPGGRLHCWCIYYGLIVKIRCNCYIYILHPGRLPRNLKMMVWKMMFLFNWVFFRFHVYLPGCIYNWLFVSDLVHSDCQHSRNKEKETAGVEGQRNISRKDGHQTFVENTWVRMSMYTLPSKKSSAIKAPKLPFWNLTPIGRLLLASKVCLSGCIKS